MSVLVVVAMVGLSCSSGRAKVGTGDVSLRLNNGKNSLFISGQNRTSLLKIEVQKI